MSLFNKLFCLLFLLLISLGIPKVIFADDPVGSWSSTTSLPYLLASHGSFSHANNVSVIGGSAVTGQSKFDVLTATPSVDGSINSWTTTSLTPAALIFHSVVKKDNYVYILGGREENLWPVFADVPKVFVGDLNNNGTVNSWTQLNSLPQGTSVGNAAVVGNRIYYAGGFNNSGNQDEIYYAEINSDGTLGSWTTSAVLLPEPLSGFGMVENGNSLIIIGGQNSAGVFLNKTYKSAINADGTLGGWQETTSLPEPVYRSGVIRIGSKLLSIGGLNGSFLDKIYYADINADATLGPWTLSSNHLPQPVCCGAVASFSNYIYLTGGFNGDYLNTVYYAPVETLLNVPLLKQTDPAWGEEIYDSANIWDPLSPTISAYGCAITSAAMVFNYYGLNMMPDGEPLNPKTLNDWLNDQQDKFFRNGSTNWEALSRLSRIAKSVNPNFTHDALDITVSTYSKNLLLQDLMNGIPDILQAKMTSDRDHFFVARGTSGEDILINDPFEDESLLSFYGDKTKSMRRYIPTNTDLSYIILVVDKDINVSVSSSSGELVGEVFIEGPIENDLGTSEPEVFPLNIFYLKQPESTNYKVQLSSSSNTNYDLDAYFYDVGGNVQIEHVSGFVGPGADDEFEINFSKDDPSTLNEVVTFDSLINDIRALRASGDISSRGVYFSLLTKARLAKSLSGNVWTKKTSIRLLKSMQKEITKQKGKGVSEIAFDILNNDIQSLILQLGG